MRGTAACAGCVERDGNENGAFFFDFSFMMSISHVFGKRRVYASVCYCDEATEAVQRVVLSIIMRHRFQDKMIGGNLLHDYECRTLYCLRMFCI